MSSWPEVPDETLTGGKVEHLLGCFVPEGPTVGAVSGAMFAVADECSLLELE